MQSNIVNRHSIRSSAIAKTATRNQLAASDRLVRGFILTLMAMIIMVCFASKSFADKAGVTGKTITVGESAAFSGPSADLGTAMNQGIRAYFHAVNAAGGVNGRTLVLDALDDGYEPTRAAANTAKLIAHDHVFALLGYVGAETSPTARPIFMKADVPFIGNMTGSPSLRSPFNRDIFNVRASYQDESGPIVSQLNIYGPDTAAIFYEGDAYGKAVRDSIQSAMSREGLKPIALATVQPNSLDVRQAADIIARSGAAVVAVGSVYGPTLALKEALHAMGSNPVFCAVSSVGTTDLIDKGGTSARGIRITQVMPSLDGASEVSREYKVDMESAGFSKFGYASMEGYIAAKVFVEGVRRAGPNLTRARLISSLESLGHYDLGGFPINFSRTNHQAGRYVALSAITADERVIR